MQNKSISFDGTYCSGTMTRHSISLILPAGNVEG